MTPVHPLNLSSGVPWTQRPSLTIPQVSYDTSAPVWPFLRCPMTPVPQSDYSSGVPWPQCPSLTISQVSYVTSAPVWPFIPQVSHDPSAPLWPFLRCPMTPVPPSDLLSGAALCRFLSFCLSLARSLLKSSLSFTSSSFSVKHTLHTEWEIRKWPCGLKSPNFRRDQKILTCGNP